MASTYKSEKVNYQALFRFHTQGGHLGGASGRKKFDDGILGQLDHVVTRSPLMIEMRLALVRGRTLG